MIKTKIPLLLPVFILFVTFFSQNPFIEAYGFENDNTYTIVYEKISPSIVSIEADLEQGISSGTGCVISPDGVILTSLHVVNKARNIEVTTQSGKNYKGRVIAILRDKNDLALVKIDNKEPLSTVKFGNSENVKVGQRVLAIGNPFGFRGTLTTGIISRIDYQRKKFKPMPPLTQGARADR